MMVHFAPSHKQSSAMDCIGDSKTYKRRGGSRERCGEFNERADRLSSRSIDEEVEEQDSAAMRACD